MAFQEDGGVDGGPQRDVDQARIQLWYAKIEESGAVGAAGGYVVDPERAQGCINEMTRITGDVRRTLVTLSWRLQFDPPGYDHVSMNVARNGAIMAGRAEAYITAWANQIEATRDALQRQLDGYRDVEQANTSGRA